MVNEKEEIAKSVIDTLIPKVQETIKSLIDGTLSQKLPTLQTSMQNQLWDKAVEMIGAQMNLPKEIIKKLQGIDDLVKSNETNINKSIEDLIGKVEGFKERLKGIDLNESVTMKYSELQVEKAKAAKTWSIVMFLLGLFIGISTMLSLIKFE